MANVVVLGAGVSGHTAAAYLRKKLSRDHKVTVITPNEYYQWVPSNIWVGINRMTIDQVRFRLEKVYKRWKIDYRQARATAIHPEGSSGHPAPYVACEYTGQGNKGEKDIVEYDYLVNATGPKLAFDKTPGLGPEHHTNSVCTYRHAADAWKGLEASMKKMEQGEKQKILIGTGHPTATCQGAAFEYILNVAFEIERRGLSDHAEITWITNEYEIGDFGMGGAWVKRGGYITSTKVVAESFLVQRNIKWIKRAGVTKVEEGMVHYETLEGEHKKEPFDFAMLIPAFTGHGIKAFDKENREITDTLFAPNGLMKVDADYTAKPYEEWSVEDWPETYQNPEYPNIYASGIAFAPPHSISKPQKSPNGTPIFPAPPRTGMPSGVTGKVVALNIVDQIKQKQEVRHRASMGKMGAACIISAGYGIRKGAAATMTVYPIVPDWKKYPEWGRNLRFTMGEAGLAGHWMKLFMHYMFLHKAKGYPLWWMLPE